MKGVRRQILDDLDVRLAFRDALAFGGTTVDIAAVLGMSKQGVSKWINWMESSEAPTWAKELLEYANAHQRVQETERKAALARLSKAAINIVKEIGMIKKSYTIWLYGSQYPIRVEADRVTVEELHFGTHKIKLERDGEVVAECFNTVGWEINKIPESSDLSAEVPQQTQDSNQKYEIPYKISD